MVIRVRYFVARLLTHANNGRFVYTLVIMTGAQFMVLIKLYELPSWWNIAVFPLSLVGMVLFGWLWEKLGFRKAFDEESNKYVIKKMKGE